MQELTKCDAKFLSCVRVKLQSAHDAYDRVQTVSLARS